MRGMANMPGSTSGTCSCCAAMRAQVKRKHSMPFFSYPINPEPNFFGFQGGKVRVAPGSKGVPRNPCTRFMRMLIHYSTIIIVKPSRAVFAKITQANISSQCNKKTIRSLFGGGRAATAQRLFYARVCTLAAGGQNAAVYNMPPWFCLLPSRANVW